MNTENLNMETSGIIPEYRSHGQLIMQHMLTWLFIEPPKLLVSKGPGTTKVKGLDDTPIGLGTNAAILRGMILIRRKHYA